MAAARGPQAVLVIRGLALTREGRAVALLPAIQGCRAPRRRRRAAAVFEPALASHAAGRRGPAAVPAHDAEAVALRAPAFLAALRAAGAGSFALGALSARSLAEAVLLAGGRGGALLVRFGDASRLPLTAAAFRRAASRRAAAGVVARDAAIVVAMAAPLGSARSRARAVVVGARHAAAIPERTAPLFLAALGGQALALLASDAGASSEVTASFADARRRLAADVRRGLRRRPGARAGRGRRCRRLACLGWRRRCAGDGQTQRDRRYSHRINLRYPALAVVGVGGSRVAWAGGGGRGG